MNDNWASRCWLILTNVNPSGVIWCQRLGNHVHCTVIWYQVFLSNTNNLHTILWYQVFLSNTNNLHTVIWYQVFLSNTNNLHTPIWYQVFLSNTSNLLSVVWFQVYHSGVECSPMVRKTWVQSQVASYQRL